ncbi:PhzF family phenazine biosynthesis protein [Occultella glacieicola]|uniref:PhzF family phenazine biosynthesis protein n=1 Tax=Occultella glacieicola TaxID=2518684 RepID=A0ABY2E865_9MICO|nr:PhzF family phenazine biosynthesis protein [Occultella glacieicola]TDE97316.1 PhzF family phenazine biosynthesis protein [Occultella glacieicola]
MTRHRPFAQVNVFSPEPYLGNPLAVIQDADDLETEQMQRIARWTNLSETVFLLTPTAAEADYRVRIFTPGGELPFAGHPTLGSAHAWLEHRGARRDRHVVVQECGAGLIEVRRDGDLLSFAAPPTLRSGSLDEPYLTRIVAAFGIERARVIAHQWIDNGPGWAVLRLATAQEVLDLDPDLSLIPEAMIGALGAYPPGSEHAYELRSFAPGVGVAEDPVCGSMIASVGQWLARTGEVVDGYRVSQGGRLDRAGDITVTIDTHGSVWVGGRTQTLFSGTALA